MRITRRPSSTIPGLGETPSVADAPEPSATSGGRVTDRVQLSEAARLRQRLKTEVGDPSASATTNARLGALQAAVSNQTYAPDPRAVAQNLLNDLAADLLA
ncbi:MAG: flagellar biosynthesis anti-sigma factor FlgM [Candidatus Binatia bacterium]